MSKKKKQNSEFSFILSKSAKIFARFFSTIKTKMHALLNKILKISENPVFPSFPLNNFCRQKFSLDIHGLYQNLRSSFFLSTNTDQPLSKWEFFMRFLAKTRKNSVFMGEKMTQKILHYTAVFRTTCWKLRSADSLDFLLQNLSNFKNKNWFEPRI